MVYANWGSFGIPVSSPHNVDLVCTRMLGRNEDWGSSIISGDVRAGLLVYYRCIANCDLHKSKNYIGNRKFQLTLLLNSLEVSPFDDHSSGVGTVSPLWGRMGRVFLLASLSPIAVSRRTTCTN